MGEILTPFQHSLHSQAALTTIAFQCIFQMQFCRCTSPQETAHSSGKFLGVSKPCTAREMGIPKSLLTPPPRGNEMSSQTRSICRNRICLSRQASQTEMPNCRACLCLLPLQQPIPAKTGQGAGVAASPASHLHLIGQL